MEDVFPAISTGSYMIDCACMLDSQRPDHGRGVVLGLAITHIDLMDLKAKRSPLVAELAK